MRKPPVVVLSGVRWDFLWQRHQALATLFDRAGYPTAFVETTGLANPGPSASRKVAARLRRTGRKDPGGGPFVYPPLVLPPTYRAFRVANRKLFLPRVARDLRGFLGERPIVVAYPPTRTTLDLIPHLDPRLVLYDLADDYERFPGAPKDIASTERELLVLADLVSCTSEPLLRKARRVRPDAFPSGPAVDYERFAALREHPPALPARTVCFFGHLGRERLDFEVLRAIARAGFRVRLLGNAERAEKGFLGEPNVEYRGEVPHHLLPAALAGVDAFILPYRMGDLTHAISPAKTYECLATGRPVVASPLPALESLSKHVYLADGPEGFVEALGNLEGTETGERVRARNRLARENSWEARFRELEDVISRSLRDRP
ncbi:glycosyltransferase [Rubrobacter tropicus]|uniref:Glycosyltransferase n=1 Tax=Rubrobacter tropicus TaxID=2653851 RepID=A0A6G8Q5L0_9ACTN|nr:glycosyltransferase [Rubrobacter tropicus]QIN81728.1 glycosyltransferase [Rubrobacter tropicus]